MKTSPTAWKRGRRGYGPGQPNGGYAYRGSGTDKLTPRGWKLDETEPQPLSATRARGRLSYGS